MSEEQISQILGQIMGKQDAFYTEFRRYIDAHDQRHAVIDKTLSDNASDINQAKGAKAAVLLVASGLSAMIAFLGKKLF